jgi:plastocyanin
MKNTALIIVVLVIIAAIVGFMMRGNNTVAPTTNDNASGTVETGTSNDSMDTASENNNTDLDVNVGVGVSTGAVKEFTVEGSNFKFIPATLTVKKGDTVKIVFKNSGGFHDWVLDGYPNVKTKQIQGGSQETITFVADKAGKFEYYCSVGTHRQMGMKGTLTVTE